MIEFFQVLTAFNFLLILAAITGYRFIGKDAERLLEYINTTEQRLIDSIRVLNEEVHMLREQVELLSAKPRRVKKNPEA